MGGGTWIYLGTFGFNAGRNNECKVVLNNLSSKVGRIITADAVKIGGGMGNIARGEVSGYPRFCEAARYWLQWAGIPDSVYSESNGKNDYTDDYKCRGIWVNYLSGGSAVNPTEKGLNIPVNMAFAFHSDAGTTLNDSIIGTLGIYYTNAYNEKFANGASRYLSHDLNITEWSVADVEGDTKQCGLSGSPTKVKKIENIVFQAKESKTMTGSDQDVEGLIVELLANHTIG